MSLTERDKKIAMLLIPVVVVFAYWFLLLAPKRKESAAVAETLSLQEAKLADAESQASTLDAAKTNFARDYAAVLRLGKAIPTSVDMPSLLVQLERAAAGTNISFESVTVGDRGAVEGAEAPTTPPAGGTAPTGEPPASGPGQAAASAQGATDTANAASAANQQAATMDPSAPAPSPGASTAAAPASSALEMVPLHFSFKGSFFELADLFHKLKRFVYVTGDEVRVRGRLMTIDSVAYSADAGSFPVLTATVKATVYLTPQGQGATAGATPAGPPPTAAASAPLTSTASSDGSAAPTPTATATP